ncbi:MAG: FAD:protein FMN transferase [Bryobacterales bacterium]|nr:FAD:protein FMN transferase [Bryobacterales bacterium]
MTSRRALLAAAAGSVAALGHPGEWVSITHAQPSMGTLFRVVAWVRNEDAGYRAIRDAFLRADDLNKKLSDYNPESELSRLTRIGVAKPIRVSNDLFRVVEQSLRISEATQGLFDITVGPLSRLWRETRKTGILPDPGVLQEARERVGYRKIHLDYRTRSIRLAKADMRLDLGGIAKGYAADAMRKVMADSGIPSAMVVAGGDVAAGAPPPRTPGWTIELDPGEEFPRAQARISLQSRAVSTSGAHQQHVTIDGATYSHIVDPRTGLGLTRQTAVSVLAVTATETDALATAASLMPPREALAFLSARPGVDGRIYRPPAQAGEAAETLSTPGFTKYLCP